MRARVYERCAEAETSLIGKAIFAVYQREAKAQLSYFAGDWPDAPTS
jgi:hypothetical protein